MSMFSAIGLAMVISPLHWREMEPYTLLRKKASWVHTNIFIYILNYRVFHICFILIYVCFTHIYSQNYTNTIIYNMIIEKNFRLLFSSFYLYISSGIYTWSAWRSRAVVPHGVVKLLTCIHRFTCFLYFQVLGILFWLNFYSYIKYVHDFKVKNTKHDIFRKIWFPILSPKRCFHPTPKANCIYSLSNYFVFNISSTKIY